ncbi:MAG: alkaline phosphatase family protein [Actinomycetota bacterium]|nr:alkaline phosphatase family protein [Actinomycetota bacterium]
MTATLPAPRYGQASLADLGCALLRATGVTDEPDVISLPSAARVCLLVVDALGWEALTAHADLAPFLHRAARSDPLDAAFPTTTAASLGAIGTGRPAGVHGLTGATVALADHTRPMNVLAWKLHGVGPRVHLDETVVPEAFQPAPTVFERAAAAGLRPVAVGPSKHAGSGLSRAIMRGAVQVEADTPADLVTLTLGALAAAERRLVYAYHGGLDRVGHIHGVNSAQWRRELARIDALVARLAHELPDATLLMVTGDHGMVDVPRARQVEVTDHPELMEGVRVLAGEPRCRHVHTQPGAASTVLAAWGSQLGAVAAVVSREEAVQAGWYGPHVPDRVRGRIGDVVAVATDAIAIVQKHVDPQQRELVGHHGALTDAERLVPLVVVA